jgi:hypothetical protein
MTRLIATGRLLAAVQPARAIAPIGRDWVATCSSRSCTT